MTPGKRLTLLEFKTVVEKVQPNIDLSKVDVYKNAHTAVLCICKKCEWEWSAKPMHIMKKEKSTGCPVCIGRHRTSNDFMNLSSSRYGNGSFILIGSFINMSTHIKLKCMQGHTFNIYPQVHLRPNSNGGCKECQANACSIRNSYTQEQWIELARIEHNNYYRYDNTVYNGSSEKVIITCPKHGNFLQGPTVHLGGCGCPKCGIDKSIASKLYTEADKEDAFKYARIHHNNRYEYTRIYTNEGRLIIEMKCPIHGIISNRLDHHLNGAGCKRCTSQYSKQQIEWLNYCSITRPGIMHAENLGEYNIPGTRFMADGYHKETNTIYEYQGDFWHGNLIVFNRLDINPRTNTTYEFLFERTKNKLSKIREQGYNIIEIWERDWKMGKKAVITIQKVWKKYFKRIHLNGLIDLKNKIEEYKNSVVSIQQNDNRR